MRAALATYRRPVDMIPASSVARCRHGASRLSATVRFRPRSVGRAPGRAALAANR